MRQATGGLVVLLMVTGVMLSGCGQGDVAHLRRNYKAELNSWMVKEEPMAVVSEVATVEGDGGEEEGEMAGAAAGEGEGEGVEPAEPEAVIRAQTVTLDIVVQHNGGGTLPGITLDIWQADAGEQDKENWKIWVETADLAVMKQFTHTLEGVHLESGDLFTVEVREYVPEGDRGEYKEFSSTP